MHRFLNLEDYKYITNTSSISELNDCNECYQIKMISIDIRPILQYTIYYWLDLALFV